MVLDTRARSSRLADYALTALALGLMARRGLELVDVVASGRWSRRRLSGLAGRPVEDGGLRVVCVVPMYLEQDIAAETVRFWHRLAQRVNVDQVLFVTTAKEHSTHGPGTREIVAAELAALGDPHRLRLLHCDEVSRFRAAQLNLAVREARAGSAAAGGEEVSIWIAVYNADSRPSDSTFSELGEEVSVAPHTRVFQQLAAYVVPERPGTGPVAVGNAILQTWWTRSHYWARNTRGRRGRSWWAATTPYSTFGHGEFVRLDFVADIGGFPDFAYADGLLLGWICRLRAEPIGLLASRDDAEVPRTGRDLITQQTAWMRGLLNFDATVAWCREHEQLHLTDAELVALRAAHLAIPVAWGFSTIAVAAGVTALLARTAARGPTRGDVARLAGVLAYPLMPALVLAGTGERPPGLPARLVGVAASWPLEGLAFWPALVSHVRRTQQAPAKTPR
ncbi:MAG: hypothetical protein ACRDT0_01655 [Pseudonocardiaceae bacterium]